MLDHEIKMEKLENDFIRVAVAEATEATVAAEDTAVADPTAAAVDLTVAADTGKRLSFCYEHFLRHSF